MSETIAIIGAGQAAAVATRALRRRGFDGDIEIIGDETDRPYQRPPLSKEYLYAADDTDLYLLPEQWCQEQRIRFRLGAAAVRIRAGDRAVELADGSELRADSVLIATGSRPRRFPGASGDRIHYLRTRRDSDLLRERLRPGARLIVVGAGFIGSEVAAAAHTRGTQVVIVEAAASPMAQLLGPEVGAACAEIHRRHGVEVRLGEPVRAITETAGGVVVTTTRGTIEGDAVVIGVGVEPNVEVAANSGIPLDDGILVDASCRTAIPNVFAAGDVACQYSRLFGERIRAEHFDNANRQAATAVDGMLGREPTAADPPWFWSDQYEVNLQCAGRPRACDEIVVRGSLPGLDFTAFYLRDGIVRAAFSMDRGADVLAAKELICRRRRVPAAVLRDEEMDLMDIALDEDVFEGDHVDDELTTRER
ncbi:MAG TPA: FAD-dependent oxidoreductase [Amycolatopsis sp.]|nr:FAD-dependent oxidoreductase [Amycolatopsis sp.]